jgi:hypothetical protein
MAIVSHKEKCVNLVSLAGIIVETKGGGEFS